MYPVDIWLSASPSNYWAQLEFTDRQGERHSRIVSQERIATINSNALQGLIEAIEVLQIACMVNVHTELDYIIFPIRNGWLWEWKKYGWRKANGKDIRNLEQWQKLEEKLARHSIKMTKKEKEQWKNMEQK